MAKLNKKLRQEIYNKYDGHCAYCGCKIEMKDMGWLRLGSGMGNFTLKERRNNYE